MLRIMPDRYLQPPPLSLDAWFGSSVEVHEIVDHVYDAVLDYNDWLHAHLRDEHGVSQSELDAMVERRISPMMDRSRTYGCEGIELPPLKS